MEASELVQRPMGGGEEVAHQVLEAPGEQIADIAGALEDRAHALGQTIGVAVGLMGPRDLLELVEEHHDILAVGGGYPPGERERIVEVALGVARGQARGKRDLELLAELGL